MFATTLGGASPHHSHRRALQGALLAAVLVLVAAAFLLRGRLLEWTGFGQEDPATHAAPPARRVAQKPAVGAVATPTSPGRTVPPSPQTLAASAGPPLTRLDRVTWERAAGGTDVVLWGNGAIPPEAYQRTRIDGNPPRELIRLSGVRSPHPQSRLVAGSAELLQVRTGYHPEIGNGELHVVLDLAHPTVAITGIEQEPQRLRIHLRRR